MKFDEYDIADDTMPSKERITNKKRKKAADRFGLTAFLSMVIGLLAGALIMMLIVHYTDGYRWPKTENNQVINPEETADKDAVVKEEIKIDTENKEETPLSLEEEDNSEQLMEVAVMDTDFSNNQIDILRESLLNGDPVSKALRKTFVDELVCARDGDYYFSPIEEYLGKNDYNEESLVIRDDGRYEYYFTDGSKAKAGIDVSKYQGEIEWDKVAADGIDFAIIRAGIRGYESGKLVMDEDFAANITDAINAGLEVGVYFFSQAVTTAEAEEEIEAVIEALDGNPLNYPIVYDIEYIKNSRRKDIDAEKSTDIARAFCDRALECGYQAMIYGNLDTFLLQLKLSQVEDIPKWLAYYDTDFYYPYSYDIWQYTESGTVDGIAGEVDLNLDLRQ